VLHKLNSAVKLIQRTTTEAPRSLSMRSMADIAVTKAVG